MQTDPDNQNLEATHGSLAPTADSLAGQLRHASKLAAMGDDMTAVYRRLGHAFRHLSDNLHQLAGDTLVSDGCGWAPTPVHLGHVRVGDWVMHVTRGPIRVELIEADGDELVFVYDGDRRVAASDCNATRPEPGHPMEVCELIKRPSCDPMDPADFLRLRAYARYFAADQGVDLANFDGMDGRQLFHALTARFSATRPGTETAGILPNSRIAQAKAKAEPGAVPGCRCTTPLG